MATHDRRKSPRSTARGKEDKGRQLSGREVDWGVMQEKDWDCVWEASTLAEDKYWAGLNSRCYRRGIVLKTR